jgi:hypothetical protein
MSPRVCIILPLLLAAIAGCSSNAVQPPQPGPTPPRPAASATAVPALRFGDGRLYIAGAPEGYGRAAHFYVKAATPLPGTDTRPNIGIVQGVERFGAVLTAHWYCRPDQPEQQVLAGSGLPVEGIGQDRIARVGRCLGHYKPPAGATWNEAAGSVDLQIDIGQEHGVKRGDRYEVLGEPVPDPVSRVVIGFENRGVCIVQPYAVSIGFSLCRLDRGAQSKPFNKEDWLRGGFVHLEQPEESHSPVH